MRHPARVGVDDEREDWSVVIVYICIFIVGACAGAGFILSNPQKPVPPELLDHSDVDVPVRVGEVGKVLHRGHVFHVPVAGEADEGAAVILGVGRGGGGGRDRVHPGRGGEGEVDGLDGGSAGGEEGAAVVVREGGVCVFDVSN